MSVQTTFRQPWIHHNLYNQFPSVEEARESVSEERQIEIGQILGAFVPELIRQFGTTPTHGHHDHQENESIIGEFQDGSLISKAKKITITSYPIAWVATPEGLFATEGINNASEEVLQLVTIIEKNARRILEHLPLEAHEKFSKLSITIDPRVTCNTTNTYFIERNDRECSILSPQSKKEVEIAKQKVVPTYKSIDSFQSNKEIGTTWCSADCLPYKGNHYYSHMKE